MKTTAINRTAKSKQGIVSQGFIDFVDNTFSLSTGNFYLFCHQVWKQILCLSNCKALVFTSLLQSWPKVVGTLTGKLYHIYPITLISIGKYCVFSNKKGNNHLIINIKSGGRGELALCPNCFVWDCRYMQFDVIDLCIHQKLIVFSESSTQNWILPELLYY